MLSSSVPLTVAELNEYARKVMAADPLLKNLEVTGEISGYKNHFTGHQYFTLKDEKARVRCAMFRQYVPGLTFVPCDGMRVTVRASASIYPASGDFQLYVYQMEKAGVGNLFIEFEKLKQKLSAEGLFDPARKREIPFFPKQVGIITARTGAAVHDMIRILQTRNPNIGITIAPCQVQGIGAAESIVEAIERMNRFTDCDVLLVGRGGGSIEDLWAFNEEIVARAIAASRIPVISCVGHETDFTIADFTADLRAATPTAAAEQAVQVLDELNQRFESLQLRMLHALRNGQRTRRLQFEKLCGSGILKQPEKQLLMPAFNRFERASAALDRIGGSMLDKPRQRLALLERTLQAVDPDSVLARGYAVVMDGEGHYLDNAEAAKAAGTASIRFRDGAVCARIDTKGNQK